jgi:competence protein ComEA
MFRRLLRDYLSLTRGERRGLQVLGSILLVLVLSRGFIPLLTGPSARVQPIPGEAITALRDSLLKLGTVSHAAGAADGYGYSRTNDASFHPFPFDPNTADLDELLRLGLPQRTASILLNYRAAGGRFRDDSDLLRVYGLDADEFRRIQPYIRIAFPSAGLARPDDTLAEPGAFTSAGKKRGGPLSRMPLFELNRADSVQLVRVYGIGPVFARRIIRYRQLLGGFCRPEQLFEVYGLSREQYDELIRCCFLDTTILNKIDLNSQDAGQLSLHPYLDRYQALALVAFREQMGAFEDPGQVIENHLLPDSVYRRIRPYLGVER